MKCRICDNESNFLYEHRGLPTFTNKVYSSLGEAKSVATFDILLYFCHSCGFIFNGIFDQSKVIYDAQYDSNQISSPTFEQHLERVADLLIKKGFNKAKAIEIGCGQGDFLKLLKRRDFEVKGFDPAFKGSDEDIVKDYYSKRHIVGSGVELIILRHVLEHIDRPVEFLRNIAEANDYKGFFYIEVPLFEWEVSNSAFWDIAPEHCNWFTRDVWSSIFSSFENGLGFGGQYQYIIAELKSLKIISSGLPLHQRNLSPFNLSKMTEHLTYYRNFVKERSGIVVWGGGGKGATFVNLVDPYREFISVVVDINIKKHGKFIAKSGHLIVGPNDLGIYNVKNVLIMNNNYKDEIKKILNDDRINLFVLGES